jgi:hypothetical protein
MANNRKSYPKPHAALRPYFRWRTVGDEFRMACKECGEGGFILAVADRDDRGKMLGLLNHVRWHEAKRGEEWDL